MQRTQGEHYLNGGIYCNVFEIVMYSIVEFVHEVLCYIRIRPIGYNQIAISLSNTVWLYIVINYSQIYMRWIKYMQACIVFLNFAEQESLTLQVSKRAVMPSSFEWDLYLAVIYRNFFFQFYQHLNTHKPYRTNI